MKKLSAGLLTLCFATLGHSASLISNGDFQNGTTGWLTNNAGVGLGGESQILTSLGPIQPVGVAQFALIDTGPAEFFGSSTPTFVNFSQSFSLGSASTAKLSFGYSLITGLFAGPSADPSTLDRFFVSIIPSSGSSTSVLSTDVSNTAFVDIPGGSVASPAGSAFGSYTPSASFSQSYALAAGTYSLNFRVENAADSTLDSGMLLESVALTTSGPPPTGTPEPATLPLIGSSLLAVCSVLYHRRKTVFREVV